MKAKANLIKKRIVEVSEEKKKHSVE